MNYTVIRDTREKENQGWYFSKYKECLGTMVKKLDSGDYSLEGFESILSIERKGSVAEFAHNVIEQRFVNEIERLELYKYSFIILEFELTDMLLYPHNCGLPPRVVSKCKFSGKFVMKKTVELLMKYNTKILFCGNSGKEMASCIFKEVVNNGNN